MRLMVVEWIDAYETHQLWHALWIIGIVATAKHKFKSNTSLQIKYLSHKAALTNTGFVVLSS